MKKLILFVLVITIINFRSEINAFINPAPDFTSAHEERVVMYATDWCPYCTKMRTFFKKNNIDYVEYDIEKSEEGRRQYDILNGRGIPLVQVDGRVIHGYNPQAVFNILKGRG